MSSFAFFGGGGAPAGNPGDFDTDLDLLGETVIVQTQACSCNLYARELTFPAANTIIMEPTKPLKIEFEQLDVLREARFKVEVD